MSVTQYKTIKTARVYNVVLGEPMMYAGTYVLATSVNSIFDKICKQLGINPDSTDYHPGQLDFDAQELAVFALTMLVTENIDIKSVERI